MQFALDAEDMGVWTVYYAAMLTIVGIMSIELFSYTASDQLFSLASGSVSLTIAGVAAVATFLFVYLTNEDTEIPSMDDEYGYLVIGSAILTAALVFSPDFAQWVADQHDIITLGVPTVSALGVGAIGYLK